MNERGEKAQQGERGRRRGVEEMEDKVKQRGKERRRGGKRGSEGERRP